MTWSRGWLVTAALVGACWAPLFGCGALLDLGELDKVDCVGNDCGGEASPSGSGGQSANVAGSHAQAGTSSMSVAGHGGSTSNAGSNGSGGNTGGGKSGAGGGSNTGGDSNGGANGSSGNSGNANGGGGSSGGGAAGSGGAVGGGSGGVGGTAGSAGAPTAGTGGQAGGGGCQPSAVDQSCDGLDQACNVTAADSACIATCKGAFVQGSAYMSCLSASTFDQAEAACQANGMHLVKIDSAAENATVLGLVQDDYVWVGGSNLADANVFTWLDGSPFFSFVAAVGGYKNFEPGQPAQNAGLRCLQFMQLTGGTWSNWTCSEAQSFVCERY